MLNTVPEAKDILKTSELIKNYIHKTPVLTSSSINRIIGAEVFFKCENFQKIGAFKFRGAINSLLSSDRCEILNGVATHSSGNHAAALALAAKMNNVPAYIVMPETAPSIKKIAVEGYGAKITFCKPTQKDREETLTKIVEQTGAKFIHPFDNYDVICGQATASKELLEEIENLDYVMTPVGGGGLLSGTSLSVKYFAPKITVIGAEPLGADDAFRSIRDGVIYPSIEPKTIADGLLTSLSQKTFNIINENVEQILTASEKSIIEAMQLIWERMKIIIEPSSALPLATIIENRDLFANKKIGIIISGGNVELKKLPF